MATQTETQVLSSALSEKEVIINAPAQAPNTTVPRNVSAEFGYYAMPKDGGPVPPVNVVKDKKLNKRNWQPATVYDVRGSAVTHTLDTTGIQYVKHKSALRDFSDNDMVKDTYYSEIIDLLTKITGASKVSILHHHARQGPVHPLYMKGADTATDDGGESKISEALKGPVRGVHVDQSYEGGPKLLKMKHPDEAEQLLNGRFQVINIWRPVNTIYRDPFAVLDATTVLEEELVPLLVIQPDHTNESFVVQAPMEGRKDGGHKWYYMSHQTPEDVLLFKIFDSKTDGRARRVPHSSFEDKEYVHMEPRASIEVRAFVFHEDDVE